MRAILIPPEVSGGSCFFIKNRKGGKAVSTNRFATNQGGVIKAPNKVTDQPKSTVVKGSDLRNGKGKK
jgi:hypothetical protein